MFEYVATCGTSFSSSALGRRATQPWSWVTHGHNMNEVIAVPNRNVTWLPAVSSALNGTDELYPERWDGCRVVETMGLRWLPDTTQRDATQTTSLGVSFEKELAEARLAEEVRLADETRLLEAAVAKLKAEAALAAAAKFVINTGTETYTRAENVNTTPVLSGTEEAWQQQKLWACNHKSEKQKLRGKQMQQKQKRRQRRTTRKMQH